MIAHAQMLVKVNTTVDKGIAPLVEALNACPGVFTTSSCEGRKNENAYVAFDVGGDDVQLVTFVQSLSVVLGQDSRACDVPFTLSLEWYAGGKSPNGYLRVPRRHIHALADVIRSAKVPVALPPSRARRKAWSDDRGHREPDRSTGGRSRRGPGTRDGARASSPL